MHATNTQEGDYRILEILLILSKNEALYHCFLELNNPGRGDIPAQVSLLAIILGFVVSVLLVIVPALESAVASRPDAPLDIVLLYSSLDDVSAVVSPTIGLGGTSTLTATDFVTVGGRLGAQFVGAGKVVSFPAAAGSVQNIELDRGEVEFWYRPNYDAGADDDTGHTLIMVGDVYDVPRLAVEESDRLKLVLVEADWSDRTVVAGYHAPLWTAGQWVHVRATWDTSLTSDTLKLYVNGARVDGGSAGGGFETQIYNQLQAFSSDNVYLLLDGSDGFVVRRVSDLSPSTGSGQSLVSGLDTSGWNDPRWHPAQPHVMIHFDSNDDTTLRVQHTNVDTLQTATIFTFPAQYERIRVPQSFDEISEDGRWLAGMASRNDGVQVIFSLDLQNLALGAQLPIPDLYAGPCEPDPVWGEVEPDWVGVSPLGNYLVVQWVRAGTTRCSGLETFNIQSGAFAGRVTDNPRHGDLGVDEDGVTEFFMTTENSSPQDPNLPAIAMHQLPGTSTVSPPIYLQVVDWSDDRAVQFSHKTLKPPSRGRPMQRYAISRKGFCPQDAPGTGAESIGKLELNSPGPMRTIFPARVPTASAWSRGASWETLLILLSRMNSFCNTQTVRSCGWSIIAPANAATGSSRAPASPAMAATSSLPRIGAGNWIVAIWAGETRTLLTWRLTACGSLPTCL